MIWILCGPPAFAGVETLVHQGRRTQTGPKEAQIAVNGFPIDRQAPDTKPERLLVIGTGPTPSCQANPKSVSWPNGMPEM
jgi:hypothetical protein